MNIKNKMAGDKETWFIFKRSLQKAVAGTHFGESMWVEGSSLSGAAREVLGPQAWV